MLLDLRDVLHLLVVGLQQRIVVLNKPGLITRMLERRNYHKGETRAGEPVNFLSGSSSGSLSSFFF